MASPAMQLPRLLAASLLISAFSAAAAPASDKPAGKPAAAEYAVH